MSQNCYDVKCHAASGVNRPAAADRHTLLPPNVQITDCTSNSSLASSADGGSTARHRLDDSLKQTSFSSDISADSGCCNRPIIVSDALTSEENISQLMIPAVKRGGDRSQRNGTRRGKRYEQSATAGSSRRSSSRKPAGWKLFQVKPRGSLRVLNDYVSGKKRLLSSKAVSNERKATKVLGIIFGVFVVLWTPFFVLNIISSLCPECALWPPYVFTTLTWLGYVSSLMNPIIYTMFNTSFRQAFVKILRCGYPVRCCRRRRQHGGMTHSASFQRRKTTNAGAAADVNGRLSKHTTVQLTKNGTTVTNTFHV